MPRPGFGTCPLSVGVVGGSSPWPAAARGRRGGAENNLEPSDPMGSGKERAQGPRTGSASSTRACPSLPPASLCLRFLSRSKRSSEKFQGDLSQAEGEGTCPRLGGGGGGGGNARVKRSGERGARARGRGCGVACWPGGPGRPDGGPCGALSPRRPNPRDSSRPRPPRGPRSRPCPAPARGPCLRLRSPKDTAAPGSRPQGDRRALLPAPPPPPGGPGAAASQDECAPDPRPALHA